MSDMINHVQDHTHTSEEAVPNPYTSLWQLTQSKSPMHCINNAGLLHTRVCVGVFLISLCTLYRSLPLSRNKANYKMRCRSINWQITDVPHKVCIRVLNVVGAKIRSIWVVLRKARRQTT